MNRIKIKFFYLFCLVQDDILTFLSGVFVSTALNILTSSLPHSILTLKHTQLILVLLMLWAAFLFIRWAIIVKPILADYTISDEPKKQYGNAKCWYNLLTAHSATKKLVRYFVLETMLTVICLLLLIDPDCINNIYQWIVSLIVSTKIIPESTALLDSYATFI